MARPAAIFLWIVLLLFQNGLGLEISAQEDEAEVTISRGALVTPVKNVLLHTDMERLIFTIPDIPDPPATSANQCGFEDEEACSLYRGLQKGVQDTSEMLAVINRILTSKGLSETAPKNVRIPDSWLHIIQGVSVPSNQPDPNTISKAGQDWFTDTEMQLLLRKIQSTNMTNLNSRERRWVKHVVTAGVKIAALAGLDDVFDVFSKMFVGDFSILNYLTNLKILTKSEYQVFANLPKQVSELQADTKELFLNVLNSTELVKKTTDEIKAEMKDHAYKLSVIEDGFLNEQYVIADVLRLLFTSTVYSVYVAAFEECRGNQIPVGFVPPTLLHSRLVEVQAKLPASVRFAIPIEDFQRYYRLPFSKCVYDSNGGIIEISIPLVETSSALQLYEFRPLQFAYEDATCAVETQTSYIIKDMGLNKIYTVTGIDQEECQPHTTGLCMVPMSAADDAKNFCVWALLSGQPASIIKESCSMQCFKDTRPKLSQIDANTFVGIHLPSKDVKMVCGDQTFHIPDAKQGSVRFSMTCGCQIFLGEKVLGKSSSKLCQTNTKPKVDRILPIQMTRFDDLLPFTSSGSDSTTFAHVEAIINSNFEPFEAEQDEDLIDTPFVISSMSWNFLQSLFMGYLYFRINAVAATLLTMGNLPLAGAAKTHTCALPNDIYVLLWCIIGICVMSLLPGIIEKIYKFFNDMYIEHVHLVATTLPRDP